MGIIKHFSLALTDEAQIRRNQLVLKAVVTLGLNIRFNDYAPLDRGMILL